MMKRFIFFILLIALILMPLSKLSAQSSITTEGTITFENTMPQWTRDLRRFDIVAFGIFPIAVMFTGLFYDMYLNNNPIGFTGNYYSNVLLISGGISLTLAATDLIIVLVNRNKERRKLDRMPSGSYEIEVIPYGEPDSNETFEDESPPDESNVEIETEIQEDKSSFEDESSLEDNI